VSKFSTNGEEYKELVFRRIVTSGGNKQRKVLPWLQCNSNTSVKFDIEVSYKTLENAKSINLMYNISE
jgi:hypothetical protein